MVRESYLSRQTRSSSSSTSSGPANGTGGVRGAMRAILDWYLRDPRSGKVVLGQRPNLPIILWGMTVVARQLAEDGSDVERLLDWSSVAFLGWWAIDELVRGVDPFRRTLGLAGCLFVAWGVLTRLS